MRRLNFMICDRVDDRHVPEIDAVRPLTEPNERPEAQRSGRDAALQNARDQPRASDARKGRGSASIRPVRREDNCER
jgi:hypothetical protein